MIETPQSQERVAQQKRRESFSCSCSMRPNLDYNYPFPIDLAANGTPLGVKLIGKL